MKKLLITEDDRKYILGLYGLIKEDIDPNSGGTITINNYYPTGYYSLENKDTKSGKTIKQQLDEALIQVTDFVKKTPNSLVEIKFISSESAIPNKDNEGKEGGGWLEIGGLSNLRKKYIETYIKNYFDSFKTQGVISDEVEIPPLQYENLNEGGKFKTSWVGQPFCPANSTIEQQRSTCVQKYRQGKDTTYKEQRDAYNTEQTSQLVITVKPKITTTITTLPDLGCALGLTIQIYVPTHNCQNAEFFVFANDTLLLNSKGGFTANLNNADTSLSIPTSSVGPKYGSKLLNPGYGYLPNGDGKLGNYTYGEKNNNGDIRGGRSDTFVVTESQSKSSVSQGNAKIVIWLICTTKRAHSDIPFVKITKNIGGDETVVYDTQPKVVEGKLLVLDECGNKISEGGDEQKPDAIQYVNRLKNQKDQIKRGSDGDDMGEDKIDTKQLLLERSGNLRDLSYRLMINILDSNVNDSENQTLISDSYTSFYNILTQTPSLEKKPNGRYVTKYINNPLIGEDMYGDVRMDMDDFYAIFNSIYINDNGETEQNGIQTRTGGLYIQKIKNKLKIVKRDRFTLG